MKELRSLLNPSKGVIKLTRWFLLFILFAYALSIFKHYYVINNSMAPTLFNKDRIITYQNLFPDRIRRGGIYVLDPNNNTEILDKIYIKRCVGIPGDTVYYNTSYLYCIDKNGVCYELTKGKLHVNNNYVFEYKKKYMLHRFLSLNEFFFVGDNLSSSVDSRLFGPLNTSEILSRFIAKVNFLEKVNIRIAR